MHTMTMRPNARLLGFILALITAATLAAQSFTAKVIGITDGDTIKVLQDGDVIRIRLHGIDCPESGQPFGTRARQFTGDLAFGKQVSVVVRDIDRYGRTVAEIVLPDRRSLNRELVKAGLAWWYSRYARDDRELERLQAEAQKARRGLWATKEPVAPWEWRKRLKVY